MQDKLAGIPLLIFANKQVSISLQHINYFIFLLYFAVQDLLSSLTAEELTKGLNLHAIRDRIWQIFACSGKDGSGLQVIHYYL